MKLKLAKDTVRPRRDHVEDLKPTGRVYSSVGELMKGEGMADEIQSKVASLKKATAITTSLAAMRHERGITQQDMAHRLGVTQSAISKLEMSKDEAVSVKMLGAYARVLGLPIQLQFGAGKNPQNERITMQIGKSKVIEIFSEGWMPFIPSAS